MGTEFQFEDEKSSGDVWWKWLHNTVNVLNVIEWYTENHLK